MPTAIIRRGEHVIRIHGGRHIVRISAIKVRGPSGADGGSTLLGNPTTGDYTDGGVPTLTDETTIADAVQAINEALLKDRTGFVRVSDLTAQNPGDEVGEKVYQDEAETVLESATSSTLDVTFHIESSYPRVRVGALETQLPPVGDIYAGEVDTTLTGSGPVVVEAIDPDDEDAAKDTVDILVDTPPVLLTFAFAGGYPGAQTELKAGDVFELTGTTDKPADAIEVADFGASDAVQVLSFIDGTSFSVFMVVGDRGVVPQSLTARARARSATTGGLGPAAETSNEVVLNNLYPTVAFGAVSYPASQGALKGAEQATVLVTLADLDTILFDSPTAELSIVDPAVPGAVKTVARIAGSYNVGTENLRATAVRTANDAETMDQTIVKIANVAASVSAVLPAARLRSGGNDGTTPQDHVVTLQASQELYSAPSMDPGAGAAGTFQGAGFAGGPISWTRALRVHDDDDKGIKTWQNVSATNLAGLVTSVLAGGATYTLGGFVARTLTFAPFATSTPMDVQVVDFSKVVAGLFTATNQTALKQPIGTPAPVVDGYTIDATGIKPTSVVWLDTSAAASNSGGTAQITNVQESV